MSNPLTEQPPLNARAANVSSEPFHVPQAYKNGPIIDGAVPVTALKSVSDKFDLADQIEAIARRHRHFDLVIDLAPDQGLAQR